MSSPLHVVRVGSGPRVVLIHGSATDHATWSIQLASPLREQLTLIAYDRRVEAPTVEAHAADAVSLLEDDPTPALLVGSSFGAVIALETLRQNPTRFAGAVLIEPPMAPDDDVATAQLEMLARFDQTVADAGGPAAAELFLRTVLSDPAYARMPRAFQERSKNLWRSIRADSVALVAYRPRYALLGSVRAPVLLLGGEQSAAYFRPTLNALAAALPAARLEVVPRAGHMLHAEAHRRFAELVLGFAHELAQP